MKSPTPTAAELEAIAKERAEAWTPGSIPASVSALHEYLALGGLATKVTKDLAADALHLASVMAPQAYAYRAGVEEASRFAAGALRRDDAAAVRSAGRDDFSAVELGPDVEAEWDARLRQAERGTRAVNDAKTTAVMELEAELGSSTNIKYLGKAWAEFVPFELTPDTTVGEASVLEARAQAAASTIEALYRIGAGVKDHPKPVRRQLREAFAARPDTMPTVEDVEVELEADASNRPAAKAREEALLRKAERKAENRAEAQAHARDRALNLHGAQALADKLGEPVLDPSTGEVVEPSDSSTEEGGEK